MELLVFLLPLLIGLALALLLSSRLGYAWVLAWLAPAIGIGVSSLLFFLWSLVFYPRFQPVLYTTMEAVLLIGLALLLWRQRRRLDLRFSAPRFGWGEGLLAAALSAALVFFIYWFLRQTAENPLGGWDAWTLWNARARYLLLGSAQTWRSVFSEQVNHSDYPYLLTGFIARCWVLIGKDRTFVPVLTAGMFLFSTVGLLGAVTAHLRGLGSGLLACLLLVSLPVFAWTAASQYADLPLACYFLACLVFLTLYVTEGQPTAALAAGAAAGFAIWTKNEGISFTAAFLIALAVALFLRPAFHWQGPRALASRMAQTLTRLLPALAGLLPMLVLVLAYRALLVPPTDLFEERQAGALLQQVSDLSRYQTIATSLWRMFTGWGNWYIPYLPALVVYSLLAGQRAMRSEERTAVRLISAILALTFLQYLGVFLITPHDLAWHISTALGRLLNQLLPGLLLLIFLSTRSAFDARQE